MKKLLSAVTSIVMSVSLMTGAFASSVSAAGSITVTQPNVSMGEVLDVSAKKTASDGSVEWLIPSVVAAPGQTVTLPVIAKNSTLAVAGAQFNIDVAAPIAYKAIVGGDAYTSNIGSNSKGNKFLFNDKSGTEKIAAEGATVFTISYTVPADCKEGKYDVKWSDAHVSDTDGFNITQNVKFTDGSITVDKSAAENTVEWIIPTVTAAPGQTVELPVTVKNSTLPVAGAQFYIDAASPIVYKAIAGGDAYTSNIGNNPTGTKFMFEDKTGKEKIAAEGSTVFTISYTIPADCAEGTYAVKWSDPNVSDTDGFDITKSVKFTDGAIKVDKDAKENAVEWIIPTVVAAPGQTITMPVIVKNSTLAVAGAQFFIDAASPIKYKSVTGGNAYTSNIGSNDKGNKFLFDDKSGVQKVAPEGSTVFTLAYTVPADCAEGTYAVKWSDANVSDTDGFDITKSVKLTDGAIKVVKDSGEGKIQWVIDKTEAYPGETVTLKAYVSNPDDVALAVAGAQYNINAETPIEYKSMKSGGAYVQTISENNDLKKFLFNHTAGTGVVAANNATIMTLTYKVPENCDPGVYSVKWADAFVSDTDGFDLTSRVSFVDGSITVKAPVSGQIKWVIDNVKASRGDKVTLNVVVEDPKGSNLSVAGAQFYIKADSPIKYEEAMSGSAYTANFSANDDKNFYMFRSNSGKGSVAADKANIMTLTYTVPTDCPNGVYPVKWSDVFVSDTDGFSLTENIIFVDGSISIGDPAEGSVEWVIPTVKGEKGKDVTLVAKVKGTADLPVAGAQFVINDDAAVNYKSATGSPYGATLQTNDDKKIFKFTQNSGKGKSAKDGNELFTLTYSVPADCPDGIYPISWAKQFVSDEDGFDITPNVKFVDGAIIIGDVTTSSTTTVTTTTTTVVSTTSTTSTTLPTPEGGIKWVIDTVEAYPGQTVKLNIVVDDAKNSALAIAGAQFAISNPAQVVYDSISGSDAYGKKISFNDDKQRFLFAQNSGKGVAAKDKAIVGVLTYKVPTDCPEGVYPVEFTKGKLEIFDEDGFSLTDKIVGQNGAIIVRKHITSAPYTSSVTTTSTEGKTTSSAPTESSTTSTDATSTTTDVTSTSDKTTSSTSSVSTESSTTTTDVSSTTNDTSTSTTDVTSTVDTSTTTTSSQTTSEYGTTTTPVTTTVTESSTSTSDKSTVSTSTVTTQTSVVSGPTTSISTVTVVPKDGIAWEVEKVTAYPGQNVVVKVKVNDPRNAQLAIAGAQFKVNADGEVTLVKVGEKSAYGADVLPDDNNLKFMFASGTGKGKVAPDGSIVVELTYKVGENVKPGTVIPVNLEDLFITDEDGFNITDKVGIINGSITVLEPVTSTIESSTVTTTVDTTTTDVTSTTSDVTTTTDGSSTTTTEVTSSTSDVTTTTDGTSTTTTEVTSSTSDVTTTTDGTSTTEISTTTLDTTTTETSTTNNTNPETTETSTTVSTQSTTKGTDETTSTSTVSTQTTTVTGPIITSSTVSIPEDGIAWKVDKVTAYPGQEVVVKVKVNDPSNTKLAIAGAQFKVSADGEVTLVKVGEKSAYGADILPDDNNLKFMFASGTGKGKVAPDGSVVVELTYKVGENVKPGTVIPITLDNMFITDEDGFDITDKVAIISGSITVVEPETTPVTDTVTTIDTTTVETTTVTTEEHTSVVTSSDVSTTTVSTQSTTKGSDESTTSTSTVSTQSTTKGSDESTTSTSTVSTQSTTKGSDETTTSTSTETTTTTNNTTQQDINITTSTNGTDQYGTDITRPITTTSVESTTSTETTSSNTTSTSTETTTSVTTSNVPAIKTSYAVIDTQIGFYFSHDNGKRANGMTGGFNKNQVNTLKIFDVYDNGDVVERATVDMELINFNGETPESMYNSRTHVPQKTTVEDFKYDVPVYYGDMALTDKDGNALTVTAYIGVKGDANLDNMVDAVDASSVLRYYASVSTNDRTVYDVVLQSTKVGLTVSGPADEFDELAAFLADVTENEWGEYNWKTKKDGRLIDSNDASKILSFYAKSSSSDYADVSSYDIWNEVLGSKRFGA